MKFRSTYILVAIVLALGLFAYLYEIRGGKAREEAKAKEHKVFEVKDSDISWIEISRPQGEPLRVERVGAGESAAWRIVKPIETRADDGAVGSITWQLGDLSYTQVADEQAADVAPFGLATPELSVSFGAGGGEAKKEYSIQFGAELPVGGDRYAIMGGQKKVLVISQTAFSTFDKQTIDLRDKRVLAFDDEKLTGLEISTPELKLKLTKSGDKWNISAPISAEADGDTVLKILDDLRYIEASEFLPSVVAQSLGLGTPEMTITLVSGAEQGDRQAVKFFMGKENTAYAWPEGDAWIYKIPPDIIQNAPLPVEQMRRRKVLAFERYDIEQVRIKPLDGKPDMLIAKNDAGDWEFVEPSGVKEKVVGSRVYDLLDSLENLEGAEFVDNPPSDSELKFKQVIILYKLKADSKDKKKSYEQVATLYLGKELEGGKRYAKGDGKQVFKVVGGLDIPNEPKVLTTPAPSMPETPPGIPEYDEEE